MKIVYTRHVLRKQEILKELGWDIYLKLIEETIRKPQFTSKNKRGQLTAISLLNKEHILRVVYEVRDDIIVVITFHVSRKGRYGT